MNVKTNKTKKQANVENQAVNLLSKEELCKRIEGVEKELKSYTWRELETNGKFAVISHFITNRSFNFHAK